METIIDSQETIIHGATKLAENELVAVSGSGGEAGWLIANATATPTPAP
ncbi:MAG: hypothetical protein JNM52_11030 [Betaproteobacteria bacterium]|nr:hypothetical protein [Betaproteobacteria bacterium]